MARVIHKFQVTVAGEFGPVEMPTGATILYADTQNGSIYIWALVDPDAETVERQIGFFGTGWEIPAQAVHLGTCIRRDRGLAWHVFERPVL